MTNEEADIAWLVGFTWQGQPSQPGLQPRFHPNHVASRKVAGALGLLPTGMADLDGETISEGQSHPKDAEPIGPPHLG